MAVGQRPLTLGEILDRTVQLYRRNFLQFTGISALPAAVMVLFFGGAGVLVSSQLSNLKDDTQGILSIVAIVGLLILIGVPISIGAFALSLSASNYAALQANQGLKATIREAYGYAFRHFWRHLLLIFLQALFAGILPYLVFIGIVVVGALLGTLASKTGAGIVVIPILVFLLAILALGLVVVCVLVWLRFSLSFATSVAEELPAWPSMQRSGRLSKGTRGRIFVMFLLVYALSAAISMALMIPLLIAIMFSMQKALAGSQPPPALIVAIEAANFAVSFLVRAFVMPIYSIALMLFYFDQRTRQEGYDIEQLMAQAGWGLLTAQPVDPVAGYQMHPAEAAMEAPVPVQAGHPVTEMSSELGAAETEPAGPKFADG